MSKYPTLEEMGVSNPDQIERYSLQTMSNVDFLRIVYKRKKGAVLSSSKKFKFGRAERMVVSDSGRNETTVIHEISPFLRKAMDELSQLVKSKHSREEQKAILSDELVRLEEEMNTRIAYIKSLAKNLE